MMVSGLPINCGCCPVDTLTTLVIAPFPAIHQGHELKQVNEKIFIDVNNSNFLLIKKKTHFMIKIQNLVEMQSI